MVWINQTHLLSLQKHSFQNKVPPYLYGKGVGGYVFRTGKITATANYWSDHRFEHEETYDAMAKQSGAIAIMAGPVYLRDRIEALLLVSKVQLYEWQPQEVQILEQFISLLALAIHNSQLYEFLELNRYELERYSRQLNSHRDTMDTVLNTLKMATRELNQPLTTLQIELELINQLEVMPNMETFERMREALSQVAFWAGKYQSLHSLVKPGSKDAPPPPVA